MERFLRREKEFQADTHRAEVGSDAKSSKMPFQTLAQPKQGQAGAPSVHPVYLQCYDSKEPEAGVLHEVPAQHEDAASWRRRVSVRGLRARWGRGGAPQYLAASPGLLVQPTSAGGGMTGRPGRRASQCGCAAGPSLQRQAASPAGTLQDGLTCASPFAQPPDPQAREGCSGRPEAGTSCILVGPRLALCLLSRPLAFSHPHLLLWALKNRDCGLFPQQATARAPGPRTEPPQDLQHQFPGLGPSRQEGSRERGLCRDTCRFPCHLRASNDHVQGQ